MGDMNYHNINISAADALAMIRHGRCRQLLVEHDELLKERAENQVCMCVCMRECVSVCWHLYVYLCSCVVVYVSTSMPVCLCVSVPVSLLLCVLLLDVMLCGMLVWVVDCRCRCCG